MKLLHGSMTKSNDNANYPRNVLVIDWKSTDFNSVYFGNDKRFKDKAGYTDYKTRETGQRKDVDDLVERFNLKGKRVLDVGCSYGFKVKRLNELDVKAFGIDFSDFALSQVDKNIRPYIYNEDPIETLSFSYNQFDLVISSGFLCCIPEGKEETVVKELNRVAKKQYHIVDTKVRPEYYNVKPVEYWSSLAWDKGTILANDSNKKEVII